MKKLFIFVGMFCFLVVACLNLPTITNVSAEILNLQDVENLIWEEDGLHFLEFGLYPRSFVGETLNTRFEENFDENSGELFGLAPVSYFTASGATAHQQGFVEKLNPAFMYRGEQFVRVKSLRHAIGGAYVFNDGTEIDESGTVYWFKVEPIRWIVLNMEQLQDGTAIEIELVAKESLVSNISFSDFNVTSIWDYSTARGFLNGTAGGNFANGRSFIDDAFNDNERAFIRDTKVSTNGPGDTFTGSPGAPLSETTDRIFLLSYSEVVGNPHVFGNLPMTENNVARTLRPTDYGLANNARVSYQVAGFEEFNGNVWWWLRTAWGGGGTGGFMSFRGHQNGQRTENLNNGLRPAMRLSLDVFENLADITINVNDDGEIMSTTSQWVLKGNDITIFIQPELINYIIGITINGISKNEQALSEIIENGYFILQDVAGDTTVNIILPTYKDNNNNNSRIWAYILIGLSVLIMASVVVYFIVRSKQNYRK